MIFILEDRCFVIPWYFIRTIVGVNLVFALFANGYCTYLIEVFDFDF